MKLSSDQKGVIVLIVLFVGLLLLIGGVGYAVYNKQNEKVVVTEQRQNENTLPPPSTTPPPEMGIDYPVPQGVKGQVFCNDKVDPFPCPTTIEIQLQSSDPNQTVPAEIRTIKTDSEGKFEYDTYPGTYIITPAAKSGYPIFVPPLPNPVVVKDRQMTTIAITYHSGLR